MKGQCKLSTFRETCLVGEAAEQFGCGLCVHGVGSMEVLCGIHINRNDI